MSIFSWLARVSRDAARIELERLKADHVVVIRDRDQLQREIRIYKESLEDLKLKKKIEEEDIKHLVKIRLEQQEIDFKKKEMDLTAEHERKLEEVRKQYDEKLKAENALGRRSFAHEGNVRRHFEETVERQCQAER